MAYNLLEERWIPVRRASGRVERIAPWQIAETDDAPVRVESPRPDFDAALHEFLIGLLQTVFTPKDSGEWERYYREGCPPEALRDRMAEERDAFLLDGDGPRFMQDLAVHRDPKVDVKPIEGLLIDRGTVGDEALFAKSGGYLEFGLPAAAAAILTLQVFAPSGGRGQCTSLRGGGPLSVTIKDRDLWRTVWTNVLTKADFEELPGNSKLTGSGDRIAWLRSTRTSERGARGVAPNDVHPLQHYWWLPRRYRLVFDQAARGRCAIFGDEDVPVVREFHSRPDGMSATGAFRHPLTPYTLGVSEEPNPRKGSASGVPYRDWVLLTHETDRSLPPKVVEAFLKRERWRVAPEARLIARGYAMSNMKPLRFVEAETPVIQVPAGVRDQFRADAAGLVQASESVRGTLARQVKSAWRGRPADQAGDVAARIDAAFWSATESSFFDSLRAIPTALDGGVEADREKAKCGFLRTLGVEAARLFDGLCPLNVEDGPGNLGRIVSARSTLIRLTGPGNMHLLACVGLAPPDGGRSPPGRRGARKGQKS